MVIENVLPIGTVVELKDIDAKVYIAGYCSQNNSRKDYVYDYSGFIFPLGYINEKAIISFDSVQIKNVVSYGYNDGEFLDFKERLEKIISEIDKNGTEG